MGHCGSYNYLLLFKGYYRYISMLHISTFKHYEFILREREGGEGGYEYLLRDILFYRT